nr:uncharacterized protein LOC109171091 [Ipomoea trifida]
MTSHPRRGKEEGKPNPGNKSHTGSHMPPWAPAPPSGRTPHLVPFTPLRAPPSDILAYAEECHLVRTPDPRPDPSGADMSKYCKYHRCHGHNTNDCQAWRKEIERLIQAGKLGNFIDWDRMAKRDTQGRGATPQMSQTGKEKDRDEPNRLLEILENYPYRAAEPAADPEKPDPDVKWRLTDGSTLPTAPEPPTGSDGKATDDVPPALSGLIRNPSAGVVVEVGMAGAGGRRRGRYSGNFHPAILKETYPRSNRPLLENLHERWAQIGLIILCILPSRHGIYHSLTRTLGKRQPIPEQAWHTRASIIVSRAGEILRPLPILYGMRLGTLQGAGMGDLLFLVFALESRVGKLQIRVGSFEDIKFHQRSLEGIQFLQRGLVPHLKILMAFS